MSAPDGLDGAIVALRISALRVKSERDSLLEALRYIANEPRSDAPAQLVVRFQRIAREAIGKVAM